MYNKGGKGAACNFLSQYIRPSYRYTHTASLPNVRYDDEPTRYRYHTAVQHISTATTQDHREVALHDLAKAIELDPFFARAHYQQGQLQKAMGDVMGAWSSFTTAEALELGDQGASSQLYTNMVQAMELRVKESGDAELMAQLKDHKARSPEELGPFLQAQQQHKQQKEREEASGVVFAQIAEVKKAGNKVRLCVEAYIRGVDVYTTCMIQPALASPLPPLIVTHPSPPHAQILCIDARNTWYRSRSRSRCSRAFLGRGRLRC